MSKRVITLATERCGYCRMLKSMVESKFPDVGDRFVYAIYGNSEKPDQDTVNMLALAQQMGVRGVPFTALVEGTNVLKVARGYDPTGITNMIKEAIDSKGKKNDSKQLEIPFPSDN